MRLVSRLRPASLHARLRWLIILVLLAVLLPLGVLSFRRTITEVDELSDGRLAQSARTLQVLIKHADTQALQGRDDADTLVPTEAGRSHPPKRHRNTYESEVGFQVFDRAGRTLLATANLAALPPPAAGDAGQ